ncbi:MAG: alpha/beta fold hydrolase [Rubrivivax sp.]
MTGLDTLHTLSTTWPASSVTVDGHEVAIVRTTGSGEGLPVLWLPGAQGTAQSWCSQLLAFGARRTLVAVNYPIVGDGAALAALVVALADALGLPRFDLVGSSLGGYIAQWVAVNHAERLGRVVLGNTFCDPTPAQSPDKLAALEGRDAAAIHAEVIARLQALPEGPFKALQLEIVGRGQTPELLRARMLAVQRAVPVPALAIPDERLLLIECDNDPLIPPPMRAALRAAHPGAQAVVIEGGGHYPALLRTQAYDAAVAGFLGLEAAAARA